MPDQGTEAARGVLELFAARCAARPDAVAVVDGTGARTYAELDAESASYAAALAAAGAGPEIVVPVVAERSGLYVAMVLGVLRAGAAFLPLDPDTPVRRAREMCAGVQATVLAVQPGHEGYAAGLVDGPRRLVPAVPAPPAAAPPGPDRPPDGLAYVIFTSGSTGKPKGAMVADAGLANHTLAKVIDLDLGAGDVIGFTAALSFDISVWQALTALTVGGTVAVASPIDISEPVELLAWVRRHGVTVLELVPSFMAVLMDELVLQPDLVESLAPLRMLIATGEALPLQLARRWYEHHPGVPLVNAYGPTECSDDVTHHIVTAAECAAGRPPSIGREIVNTTIYLVDAAGRPVPPGEEGELLVGGICVGRGYMGDPVRTALAFVPDHLSGRAGARLYRTGDRGVRASDGTIDFLGRRDRQVKVRGQRVELGDVEAELLRAPGVAAAAAVYTGGRLHAFVTSQSSGAPAEAGGILDALRAEAPGYLVPHEVTVLDRIPTNSSGKVDYGALERLAAPPAPEPAGDGATALDAVSATVAEVLEVPGIGPDDDFFAAGGDSLLAMTLLSLARRRFEVPTAALSGFLTDPTPRGLLAVLTAAREEAARAPARPGAEAAPGALSSGQERLWFLEQLHPTRYVQLIRFGLSFRGHLDMDALRHALAAVVARHEPWRTVFAQERGVPSARVLPGAEVPLRVVELAPGAPPPAPDAGDLSARTEQPPLLVAQVARVAPDHHVLSLVLHHLIADGFSLGVLGQEIGTYYRRFLEGDPGVDAPGSTYSEYVAAERRWLDGPEGAAAEQFWHDQLADAPRFLDLPLDHPHPARPNFRAANVVHVLDAEETAAVCAVARAARATPLMAASAALYGVLRRLTGSDDLVIGIDSANRSWPGSEALIGTFVNQLPLRLDGAPGEPSFRELLELVRQRSLAAYANDRLPFHKIVAAVNPPRRAGRFPLFQVKVTHQGAWRAGLALPGVEVVPDVLSEPVTDLDLMLDVSGENSRLRLELVYRPEIVDEDAAAAWVAAVGDVLRAGAADPDVPLADHRVSAPTAAK